MSAISDAKKKLGCFFTKNSEYRSTVKFLMCFHRTFPSIFSIVLGLVFAVSQQAYALTSTEPVSEDGSYVISTNKKAEVEANCCGFRVDYYRIQETYINLSGIATVTQLGTRTSYSATSKAPGTYNYKFEIGWTIVSNGVAANGGSAEETTIVKVPTTAELASIKTLDRYDIYYGDINSDGRDGDIYLHGKDLFVLIAGDINIPLSLQGPPGILYAKTADGHALPQPLTLNKTQLTQYLKGQEGRDYAIGDINKDGKQDLAIRGKQSGMTGLVLMSAANLAYAVHQKFDASSTVAGEVLDYMDRSRQIRLEDKNGDGVLDISLWKDDRLYASWDLISSAAGVITFSPAFDKRPLYQPATLVGSSDGNFRVTEQGAATYVMPISLPAGTAGVVPSVSLSYSSQAGNDIAGLGWSLSAYSAIRRCPKTLSHDGKSEPLKLDDQDALCLDGSRLIPSGTYLRTELDSNVRVKKQTDHYTVEGKDGSIKFYGKTTGSRQIAGDGKIIQWALNKACDSVGNCIDYQYAQVSSGLNRGSDFRLTQIAYAYGSQAQVIANANATVDFIYEGENRGDSSSVFVAGNPIVTSKRLKEIQVKSRLNSSLAFSELRRYALQYKRHSPADPYIRSYLDGIQECVGGDCLPETRFTWVHNTSAEFGVATWDSHVLFEKGHSFMGDLVQLDINGDGYMDIAWVENDQEHANSHYNGYVRYAFYDPATKQYVGGQFSDGEWYRYISGGGSSVANDRGWIRLQALDYNADGRMDLALYANGLNRWQIHYAVPVGNGWRLAKDGHWVSNIDLSTTMLDVDSDGLVDILNYGSLYNLKNKQTGGTISLPYGYQLSTTTPAWTYAAKPFTTDPAPPTDNPLPHGSTRVVSGFYKKLLPAGDMNGDGAADVLLIDRKYAVEESYSVEVEAGGWNYVNCKYVEEHYYAMLNSGKGLSFSEFAYLGSAKELNPNPKRCDSESDTGPMLSIQTPNLNNDAYTDLVIRKGQDYMYFLNDGKKFIDASLQITTPTEAAGTTIQKYVLTGGVLLTSFASEEDAKKGYVNFVDINNDGFGDLVKGVPVTTTLSYYYQNWLPQENKFSSYSSRMTMPSKSNTNRYVFLDATGDGHLDYLRVYDEYKMQLVPNKTTGLNDLIVGVKNGLGANTAVQYEMLTSSANYQSIEDRLAFEQVDFNADGQAYTFASLTTITDPLANYYPVVRNPFSGPLTKEQTLISKFTAPVFEYMAPVNVVTKVTGDAPSSNSAYGQYSSFNSATKAEVEYYYGSARVQAGGRGFLGFRYVATKDPQSGVIVETRYRQDWPFVGVPETTITYTPVTSAVKPTQNMATLYAQSIKHDQHKLQNWVSTWPGSANVTNGTAALGPMKIYLDRSEEVSFQFSSHATTPAAITPTLVSGGNWCSTYTDSAGCKLFPRTTAQAVLQRNVTTQVYDAHNNPLAITVITQGPGLKQTKVTKNDFGGPTVDNPGASTLSMTLPPVDSLTRAASSYPELGRIRSAKVTTTQERSGQTTTMDEKTSTFTYFTSGKFTGLLQKEVAFAGLGNEFEQASTYAYDNLGNKNSISTEAKKITYNQAGTPTIGAVESRKARTEYDLTGRYLEKTYKNFGSVLGDKLLEQVSARAANGAPTSTRSDLNALVTTIEYDVLGREIARASNVGADAWSETDYLPCDSSLACPPGTAFVVEKRGSDGSLARAYTDILGRTTRETAKNFQGDMVHVDTQYDLLGRVIRTSQPYKVNTSALYWTENQYDVLGRVIETRAPDAGINIFRYNGYTTVATNALTFNKTEVRNGFGELIEVRDHLGTRLEYVYNTRSQLEKVIKHRAPSDAAFIYVSGSVTTLIEYDVTGRKTKMIDADKGAWEYKYNAFGELLWQKDAKGQVQLQNYDGLGRLSTRTDYKADATVENHTRWYYDGRNETSGETLVIANAIGQMSAVVMTDRANPATQACTLANGARQCNSFEFDSFGRAKQTTTQLFADNKFLGSYKSKVEYDSFGRISEEYDALNDMVKTTAGTPVTNSGTRNHYSLINGELEKVIDLASGIQVYKILEKSLRGQPGKVLYGNGLTTQYSYYDDTGLPNTTKTTNTLNNLLQDQTYRWDKGANLIWRANRGLYAANSTRNILESFCYDSLNRLVRAYRGTTSGSCDTATPSGGGSDVSIYTYDSFGNTKEKYTRHNYTAANTKTGFNSYLYGADKSDGYTTYAGPHAVVRTMNIATNAVVHYRYDQNGNMIQDEDGRSIAYSTYDMPTQITKGTHNTWFAYGVDRGRYWRKDTSGGKTLETLYLGNVERITQGTTVIWKRYVAGVALYETKTDTNNQTLSGTATYRSYMHKDHLGSLDVITNDAGQPPPVEALGFDSWGERRNPASAKEYTAAELVAFADAGRPITSSPNYSVFAQFEPQRTTRGYTGHEMLDESGIIHMNGRIYDPTLGRFLQADPIIQASTNTQSYNRYTYVFNNPLNAVDPSGFISSGFYEFKRAFGLIAAVAYSVYCWGTCSAVAFAFIAAMGAAVNGADFKGVLIAAVAAYAGAQVGGFKELVDKVVYAGVVGGVSAILTGGKFGHSFVASGIGAYFGAADWAVNIDSALARVGLAAVVGGTTSELTGGKFKNGAGTAAFMAVVSMAGEKGIFSDSANKEPDHITNDVKAKFGKSKISVQEMDDETVVTIKLKLEQGMTLSDAEFKQAVDDIEREWNTSGEINGRKYVVKTEFSKVNTANPLAVGSGDIIIESWSGVPRGHEDNAGLSWGNKIAINRGMMRRVGGGVGNYARPSTAAHEFGHAIGLGHQPNSTGSIMSYADVRSVMSGTDIERLANVYR